MYYSYLHFKDEMAEHGEIKQLAQMKPSMSSAPRHTDFQGWKEFGSWHVQFPRWKRIIIS